MAILFQAARVRLNANQQRTYGPVTVPSGFTLLRVTLNLTDADFLDPTAEVSWTVEASANGTVWVLWGAGATHGSDSAVRQAALADPLMRPRIQMACPPVGWQVRSMTTAGGSRVDLGVLIEGF